VAWIVATIVNLSIGRRFVRISMCGWPVKSRVVEQRKLKRVTQISVEIKDQTKQMLTILREWAVAGSKTKTIQMKIQRFWYMTTCRVVNSKEM
jgi:hypothetical protein